MTLERKITSILTIAIIAASMIGATAVIGLTMVTEGLGIQHAKACQKDNTGPGSCGNGVTTRRVR